MDSGTIFDTPQWYAIHTKPKEEGRAEANLSAWQMETFNPKIRGSRRAPFGGALGYVVKPLFPRYIFARFEASRYLHKVHYTRGVHSVVSFGGQPVHVDQETIDLIRSRVDGDGLVKLDDGLEMGDAVTITEGKFKGLTGVFNGKLKGTDRVMILLTAVNYRASIIIDGDQVQKTDGALSAAA